MTSNGPGPVRAAIIIGKNEKRALVGVAASLILWWTFQGKKKYSLRGMK